VVVLVVVLAIDLTTLVAIQVDERTLKVLEINNRCQVKPLSVNSSFYARENARSPTGKWRKNDTRNHYESWLWQSDVGVGFKVVLMDGVYYRASSTGTTDPHAFKVISGQQLVCDNQD